MTARVLLLVATALCATACRTPFDRWVDATGGTCELAIVDALVVDGTGAPARIADVLVEAGRIEFVGDADLERCRYPTRGKIRVVEANGLVLAPGFIDLHAHGDPLNDSFESALAMGVTTVVIGQDGAGAGARFVDDPDRPARHGLGEWLDALDERGAHVNVVAMAGHGTLRHRAGLGPKPAPLSEGDLDALRRELRADLDAGAFGMTTGLEYVPGRYSDEAELVALARVVGEVDGVVMSHMRTEDDDGIEAAIDELAAQGAHARVHVSHLKIVYGKGAERAERVLDHIDAIRGTGVEMTADIYPYTAGYTGVAILFPGWALPPNDYDAVVAARRDELAAYLEARVTKRNGPGALLFGSAPYRGKTLEEAAAEAGMSFVDFLIDIGPGGGSGAHFTQDEATHDALVASPLTAISTDGGPSVPHPRSTGTFARLFERHVVELEALTLEEAVHQATGLPARVLGRDDIGVVRAGAWADLVLFDPERVRERSSYLEPMAHAEGFDLVLVSGRWGYHDGGLSIRRYGRILRRGRESDINRIRTDPQELNRAL